MPSTKWLENVSVEEAKRYISEGHYAPGSMLPKVQAAVDFAESKEGRTALITLLEKSRDAIQGKLERLSTNKDSIVKQLSIEKQRRIPSAFHINSDRDNSFLPLLTIATHHFSASSDRLYGQMSKNINADASFTALDFPFSQFIL